MDSTVDFEGGLFAEKKTIKWKINNFDIIIKSEDYLKSQEINFDFTDRNGIKSYWNARMSFGPSKDNASDNKILGFDIEPVKKGDSVSEINAQFWLRFEDAAGQSIFRGSPKPDLKHSIGKGGVNWEIKALSLGKDPNLTDGTIFITIVMKTFSMMKTSNLSNSVEGPANKCGDDEVCVNRRSRQFYETISNIENDEVHSDVKIVSRDGQEFFAYRWILSAVSDVFEAMFRSNMLEKKTGVLRLDDLAGATLNILLRFIYSGKVDKNWSSPEIVEELIYAADKFQLNDFKEYLDENLGNVCTVENVGNLLDLANKANMKNAVANMLEFIKTKCANAEEILSVLRNMKN